MASAQCQKPNTSIEVCQPKSQHSSLGQKISEMTNKFKGHHHGRHGSSQSQTQCYSQTQGHHGCSKTETHCYSQQTETQNQKKEHGGVGKTQITVCVVQAQITHENHIPHHAANGTTTTCFGNHGKRGEHNNNKERNLFRRIKGGISRRTTDGSSSSSESDSDNDNCSKRKN